ncbi:MAG: DNA topoisomerase IB [Burkholderiales bacterium]
MALAKPVNGNSHDCARAAGLRHVSDTAPGIARLRRGKAFLYRHAGGGPVRDPRTLGRIRALAIPPAWRDVWICEADDGHLQATGRDARQRKQYRYHRRWREVRDETKYGRLIPFAAALPRIRRRVARDLARPGLPRAKVLATVVRLLETTRARIGNEEYARENESFGLTTLRERQVRVQGTRLKFRFRGKSGVEHAIELDDRRLAGIVRRMQDLPGEELFRYVDDGGETRRIESADVNAYLKESSGDDFSSKDFRTWAGTVLAARALHALGPCSTQAEGRRNIAQAIAAVAGALGNTKAVCRKCYVHPEILESYLEGEFGDFMQREGASKAAEKAVAALLKARSQRAAAATKRSGARGRSLVPALARSLAHRARRLQRNPQLIARGAP